jgi:hypothetical protein
MLMRDSHAIARRWFLHTARLSVIGRAAPRAYSMTGDDRACDALRVCAVTNLIASLALLMLRVRSHRNPIPTLH